MPLPRLLILRLYGFLRQGTPCGIAEVHERKHRLPHVQSGNQVGSCNEIESGSMITSRNSWLASDDPRCNPWGCGDEEIDLKKDPEESGV
jgi:hypothetical protein